MRYTEQDFIEDIINAGWEQPTLKESVESKEYIDYMVRLWNRYVDDVRSKRIHVDSLEIIEKGIAKYTKYLNERFKEGTQKGWFIKTSDGFVERFVLVNATIKIVKKKGIYKIEASSENAQDFNRHIGESVARHKDYCAKVTLSLMLHRVAYEIEVAPITPLGVPYGNPRKEKRVHQYARTALHIWDALTNKRIAREKLIGLVAERENVTLDAVKKAFEREGLTDPSKDIQKTIALIKAYLRAQ